MLKHLQPLLLPASITLLLFALTYGLGRWNGGGPVDPQLTRMGYGYTYVFTAEARERLPERLDQDWLESLPLSPLLRVNSTQESDWWAKELVDSKVLLVHTTAAFEKRLAAWMDANVGPDSWRYNHEHAFKLSAVVSGRKWGLECNTRWVASGKPGQPLLSTRPSAYVIYGFNNTERTLINHQHLWVTTQRLRCIGPVWPTLLLLCALPVFLLHFLRRPLLHIMSSVLRRTNRAPAS